MKKVIFVFLSLIVFTVITIVNVVAEENCTAAKKKAVCNKDVVKANVDKMCDLVKSKGKDGVAEVKKFRFDCCGEPDYIWLQTMEDKPKMVMHPIKPQLDGKDISESKDPDGKALFVEFVKAAKVKPEGDWVPYKWTKFGESDPTSKVSWVKPCKTPDGTEWLVGSGTWE
ncbi:MAG: cache domain-containing protein [Oligoflexia bacterium]|nr:cache domain-containing protein [Oligoflexia bacterium]